MDKGSTTAAETTSDTQAETETENKEGTSIKSQMLKMPNLSSFGRGI